MIAVSDIPESWRVHLKSVQEKFPDAVIAGGCLRELANGKISDIKDIDVFLPSTSDEDCQEYVSSQGHIVANRTKNYGNLSNDDINSVYTTGFRVDDKAVEFIAVTTPKHGILDRFDFGLCQIMFDGNEISYTDAFKKDIDNHTLTLLRCDSQEQFKRSKKRYERISTEKYNGWTLVTNGFEKYEVQT